MNTATKKEQIKKIALNLLNQSYEEAKKKIEKSLNCGALDLDQWSEKDNPMIIPKIIIIAILEDEASQYKATGTKFEKQVIKEVRNLKLFL
jgi:hypothetical protein